MLSSLLSTLAVQLSTGLFILTVAKVFDCRNVVYDSSLGGCLQSLYSWCSDDVVRSTAAATVRIFPESMLKTGSLELKVNYAYHYLLSFCYIYMISLRIFGDLMSSTPSCTSSCHTL